MSFCVSSAFPKSFRGASVFFRTLWTVCVLARDLEHTWFVNSLGKRRKVLLSAFWNSSSTVSVLRWLSVYENTNKKWISSRYAARVAFRWEVPLAGSQARANCRDPRRDPHRSNIHSIPFGSTFGCFLLRFAVNENYKTFFRCAI